MKSYILILAALVLTSCASTMPGSDLNLNTNLLSATVNEDSTYSSDTIKLYQISLKNTSTVWIDIDSVTLEDPTSSASVLVGGKMNAWIDACKLEKSVSDYNKEIFFGSIAAAGIAVGGLSQNNTTSVVGLSLAAGALTAAGVKELIDSKNKAEFQESLPEGHLLRPFYIPSLKVVQRWVIVENPKNVDLKFVIKSKVKEVGSVSFVIPSTKAQEMK